MRDIKFRFWDDDQKEFTSKCYIEDGLVFKHLDYVTAVTRGDVIPLQFTGLKDKNGKEVYESDIVVTKRHGYKYVVEYAEELGQWGGKAIDIDPKNNPYLRVKWMSFSQMVENGLEFEVVGNKYENPELLENKDV